MVTLLLITETDMCYIIESYCRRVHDGPHLAQLEPAKMWSVSCITQPSRKGWRDPWACLQTA